MPILGRCWQTARLTFHVRSRSNFQKFLTVANSGKASATSSTIITGEPNEFVRQIHTRMPVILPEEQEDVIVTSYTRWLESVQVIGTENQEIFVTFSSRFERKRLPEQVASVQSYDPGIVDQEFYQDPFGRWSSFKVSSKIEAFVPL
jgi:putative SOS response-associated peptidase YedK